MCVGIALLGFSLSTREEHENFPMSKPINPDGTRASTTGRIAPPVDMTDWRQKLNERKIKFDDEQKKIYLAELADHGLKGRAATAAGVALQTVANHRKNDPVFAEAEDAAWQARCDAVRGRIEADALEGFERNHYKDGELIKEERVYETPIRLAMLKRHDAEYKDKMDLNVTGSGGGVLVVPMRLTTEEWIALYSPKDEPPAEDTLLD